ncbi:MAG TPA: four helix bundle protein [Chitinophagaceae bacterium]|nr:four helix bundle protein [Chitinophagaceae bacterium]
MFLTLNHQNLDAYRLARKVLLYCYAITRDYPPEEKFSMVQQIRRSALSVVLNIAEGASRKSAIERRRFFEIARGSLVEIDAAFDVAADLNYAGADVMEKMREPFIRCFQTLSKLTTAGH